MVNKQHTCDCISVINGFHIFLMDEYLFPVFCEYWIKILYKNKQGREKKEKISNIDISNKYSVLESTFFFKTPMTVRTLCPVNSITHLIFFKILPQL